MASWAAFIKSMARVLSKGMLFWHTNSRKLFIVMEEFRAWNTGDNVGDA